MLGRSNARQSLRSGIARFLAVLIALFSGASAFAQSDATVTGEVVVTATRFPEYVQDKPISISVITSEQIERSTGTTVPDQLQQEAGINVRDLFGNNAASTTVDLRGFGAAAGQNTLILVDGMRVGDIDLAGVQWSSIPLASIDRIEIVRGGGAVQYGDGAVAGVVNIITKSPAAAGNSATIGAMAGNLETLEEHVAASLSGEHAGIYFGASNYDSQGYRDNNRNKVANAYTDVRWLLDRTTLSLKLGGDAQNIRLPGARTVQPSAGIDQLENDPRGTSTPLDYATQNNYRAMLELQRQFDGFDLALGLGYRAKQQTSYFDFNGFPDYREVALSVWSFTPRVKAPFWLLGCESSVAVGVDLYHWNYQLDLSNSRSNINRPTNVVTASQNTSAVYVQDTTSVTARLTMTAGLRYERQDIDAADTFDPTAPGGAFGSGAPAGSQANSATAWELGARYQVSDATSAFGRVGRSFRFATVDEIYETSALFTREFQFLLPQTAITYEGGIDWRQGALSTHAAIFLIDIDNEIHLDPFTTGVGNTNLPPTRRTGLELELRWSATPTVDLRLAYAYTDARFLEGTLPGSAITQTDVNIAGKAVPLVPRNKLTVDAAWAVTPLLRTSGSVTYVSSQFMENDESNSLGTKIPPYAVTDLKLVFTPGSWRLSAAVNNLFNEKYYTYAVRSQFVPDRYNAYPLPERTFWVGAEYTFR